MDYDLTRLGEREFEHLSQALAVRVLGNGVRIFGDGPDGGREATFEGRMRFPEPGQVWSGYGVLQAKFKRRLNGVNDAGSFIQAVKVELAKWADPRSRRARGSRRPDYVLFSTNVVLSAVPGSGGIDAVNEVIAAHAEKLGLKGWRVWHHDELCRLLDLYPEVRKSYAALITPSDVLSRLDERLGGTPGTVGKILAAHAAKELMAQQWVQLGQAGHTGNQRLSLGDIAVDLPATAGTVPGRANPQGDREIPGVVAHLVARGDTVFRPSRKPTVNSKVVIVGGPGQGKSTLGQLLCQVYRTALVVDSPQLEMASPAGQAVRSLRSQFARLSIQPPACLRWPLLMHLSAYGDEIAGGTDRSVLRFLATQVSNRSHEQVTASQLRAWLGAWPWLIVLDGLDEVASAAVREELVQKISEFLIDAADVDADLMLVATTRPQGYALEFSPAFFEHFELRPLNSHQAMDYSCRLAAVRHADDPDLERQVVDRVKRAAADPITARLMRSPLQVTIMSILLERRVRVPQDRHSLFDAYYDTIYDREVAKPGHIGLLLDQQRGNVHALHERVALTLQIYAERGGDAEALLPKKVLHDIAIERLLGEGHDPHGAEELATTLVDAATKRLVLLVPLTEEAVGFEVRSLQEFMAARSLVTGDSDDVLERLRRLAPSAHWRNTWLLAAGRVFARDEHLRDRIVTLLDDVDGQDLLTMLVAPGAGLALDILHDDIAVQAPRYRSLFTKHALQLVEVVSPGTARRLADGLYEASSADPKVRRMVENVLDRALASRSPAYVGAMMILARWEERTGAIATSSRQRLHRIVNDLSLDEKVDLAPLASLYPGGPLGALAGHGARRRSYTLGSKAGQHVMIDNLAPETAQHLRVVLQCLNRVRLSQADQRRTLDSFSFDNGFPDEGGALSDPKVQEVIIGIHHKLSRQDWQTAGALRDITTNWLARRPVGHLLLPA